MGYGPGQPKSKILPYVITALLNGESPKLTSGKWQVDWIFIDDLIDGIITATTHPKTFSTPIELGSGKLTSVKEMVEIIVKIINTDVYPQFGVIPDRFSEHPRIARVDKTFDMIGWKPKLSVEDGLTITINWFKENAGILNYA